MAGTNPGAPYAMPLPEDELAVGTVVGEYRIESKIGQGGMGVVYSAMHPIIGKAAAVKVIGREVSHRREAVQRFVQEAQAVNQIAHPNIVDIFSLGTLPDGRPYFVMELLRGENIAGRLQRGPIPLIETLDILEQICGALIATHRKSIIHRDLKPENVFIDDRGERRTIKLLDFGIAKLMRSDTESGRVQITQDGSSMGTPTYASPELARGRAVDERGDIYSLGVMAFEMILGRTPFHAEDALDMFIMHVSRPPPVPASIWPEIPPALDDIILRMLAKDPAARPALTEIRDTFMQTRMMLGDFETSPHVLTTNPVPPLQNDSQTRLAPVTGDGPGRASSTEDVIAAAHPPRWRPIAIAVLGVGIVTIIVLAVMLTKKPADVVEGKPETKIETRVEAKVEPSTEIKPEAKIEAKIDPKPEAKIDPKPEAKPEAKIDPKPETKTDAVEAPLVENIEETPRERALRLRAKLGLRPDAKPDRADVKPPIHVPTASTVPKPTPPTTAPIDTPKPVPTKKSNRTDDDDAAINPYAK